MFIQCIHNMKHSFAYLLSTLLMRILFFSFFFKEEKKKKSKMYISRIVYFVLRLDSLLTDTRLFTFRGIWFWFFLIRLEYIIKEEKRQYFQWLIQCIDIIILHADRAPKALDYLSLSKKLSVRFRRKWELEINTI